MPHTLFLPGINPKTEIWAKKLLDEVSPQDNSKIQRYAHWQGESASGTMNLDEEALRLRGTNTETLIAKSMGTILALKCLAENLVTARRVICIGTPVENFDLQFSETIRDLRKITLPILFIQQKEDIVGSYARLCSALHGIFDCSQIVEVPGNDHLYKDIKMLARLITKWSVQS